MQLALDKIRMHYPETDAMAEYIKRLWVEGSSSVFKYLERHLKTVGDLQPHEVEVRFVFGVPAIWEKEATDRMKGAIEKSGILAFGCRQPAVLNFVHEPVAAATAVIPEVASDHGLKVGDNILILDCGGGTVDTVVYKLKSVPPNPVETDVSVAPQGRFLGAIFMKSAFVSFVKQQVELPMIVDQAEVNSKIDEAWTGIENQPLMYWDSEDTAMWLHIQDTDTHHFPSHVKLSRCEVLRELLPTAKKIVAFAEEQVQAAGQVARVVVVGGFGRNALVQAELKAKYENVSFTDGEGELAVKRGTCLEGIRLAQVRPNPGPADQDNMRKVKASFGYCPDHTSDLIEWFICKDNPISKSKLNPTLFPFPPATAFEPDLDPSSSTMHIYRTGYKMNGLRYQKGDSKVAARRVVKCKNPGLLTDGTERKLGMYMVGNKVEFVVFVDGQPCADKDFSVTVIQT